jgi:ABC-2 type transport system ATP-binding protein
VPDRLVTVAGAGRRFGGLAAVDDVSLHVDAGEIVGLLGANGAGKTTLLRMILGLLPPSAGTIDLFGAPPTRAARRRLGYVPQGLGLYTDLTVVENAAFASAAFGVPLPVLPAALEPARDRLVAELGPGHRRQLAFTIALAHHPELLVLDEPTSGADPLARARLWDAVHAQAGAGVGVLVTTHYLQEAQQCHRLVLLSRGRGVAAGSERDIVGDATAVAVHADAWAPAFAALDGAGLPVLLAGTVVRVAGAEADRVGAVLRAAGVEARLDVVPATLDEAMLLRERIPSNGDPA